MNRKTVLCSKLQCPHWFNTVLSQFLPPYKLIVEENYLLEQIFNVGETCLFWKWMPERTLIHKEAKSMPGFRVCVSTLYDVRTTRSPDDAFLRTYPCHYTTHDCTLLSLYASMVWAGTLFYAQSFSVHAGKLCDLTQSWVSFFHLLGSQLCLLIPVSFHCHLENLRITQSHAFMNVF